MTSYDPIRFVGDIIELNGEPFAKMIVPEYRRNEFLSAIESDEENRVCAAYEEGEERGWRAGAESIIDFLDDEFNSCEELDGVILIIDKIMDEASEKI